jgi:DNA-binding NarL/FixJ family response regulator
MSTKLKVLVVEDESFTRQLVANALTQQGFEVLAAEAVSDAIQLVRSEEPNVLVSDLDLGSGASGLDLLKLVSREFPWIGLVVLTAHNKPVLAGEGNLPDGATYLVKSAISDLTEIGSAVYQSISNLAQDLRAKYQPEVFAGEGLCFVSQAQAETLRLLSKGLTNQAIAELRGTSLRAVENMIQRTYKSLGLNQTGNRNLRVEAVSIWRQGKVQVR